MKTLSRLLLSIFLLGIGLFSYSQKNSIRINQLGYYPDANKIGFVVFCNAANFEIIDLADSSIQFTGDLGDRLYWRDAGDSVRQFDFSDFTKEGMYKIHIPGYGESYPFEISKTVYRKAAYASLKSYYYQRCSFELTEEFAGIWARGAGHPDDACVFHSSTGKTGTLSSPGGWYDAGDFGKYVVNAGISVATLLSFYENFSHFFEDGSIQIPESGNGINDLLDEVKYELDWLKTMQDDDGGVFHKLTTLNFTGTIMPENANSTRYVIGKSTAATLDFAAMMAMAGRIYQDYDADYANDCILRAENAWIWAKANPTKYFNNPSDVSTGQYGDSNVSDEFIWASAELYITTAKEEYKSYLESKSSSLNYNSTPGWPNVQPLASLSLLTQSNGLSESLLNTIKNSLISTTNNWLNQINSNPARIPNHGYWWGSNSGMANMGVGLLYAYIVTEDPKYIKGAAETADYILGKNATGFSFVSSYGNKTPMNFHHRASGADGIAQPVPGFVAGGPNKDQQDNEDYPFSDPAKSYVDVYGSYASNEVCINWNSPLTALLAGVDAILGDSSDIDFEVQTLVNDPPTLRIYNPLYDSEQGSDAPVVVNGLATDPDGVSKVELYVNNRFYGAVTSGAFEWELNSLSINSHTVTVLAYDIYGLASAKTHIFSIKKNNTVPGKIEAEDFSDMSGIITETTTDVDGGRNVTGINSGDWIEYSVNVLEGGKYRIDYRVASNSGGGEFTLGRPSSAPYSTMTVEATGGFQEWVTISDEIRIPSGQQTFRLYAVKGGWNINWMYLEKPNSVEKNDGIPENSIHIIPNPVDQIFTLQYQLKELSPVEFTIFDSKGKLVDKIVTKRNSKSGEIDWILDDRYATGTYFVNMMQNGKKLTTAIFLKTN
jgi:endoglucanase